MKPTSEQEAIINSSGHIRINAVAGSGKTSTLIAYAKNLSTDKRILYLAFNKTVKTEAIQKFAAVGLSNVVSETAHSLAFKSVVPRFGYQIQTQAFKSYQLTSLLKLPLGKEKNTEFILANHVLRYFTAYCNSAFTHLKELPYKMLVQDEVAKKFVAQNEKQILFFAKELWQLMETKQIPVTHDFYLKKFQLLKPQLHFDYILFDEAQDASAVMLEMLRYQKSTLILVGDSHQQIYGWRYAINSMERVPFPSFPLTQSFRFPEPIAQLATQIVQYKNHLGKPQNIQLVGKGKVGPIKSKAVLARTNLGLLVKAIAWITEPKNKGDIYFEGNLNSYTYAEEGASLYDVLNLHLENRKLIRDPMIGRLKDLDELEEYTKVTEDAQLGMMIELVREYDAEIPIILNRLKNRHVPDSLKHQAAIIFSTVHRCKGMEYDEVELVNDFLSEEKLKKLISDTPDLDINASKLSEEINLLYVAITRAKSLLKIPAILTPENFIPCAEIELTGKQMETTPSHLLPTSIKARPKEKEKEKPKASYRPWTLALDEELTTAFEEGESMEEISYAMGRTRGAIWSRLRKLGLVEE
jgi:superfamily I DNA/RNA helicase